MPGSTIVKGRKFDQVLAGARKVFFEQGYEGASVDEIAKAAGVSKATLYSYFPEKRAMLLEVARQEFLRQADAAEAVVSLEAPPEKVLPVIARILTEHLVSKFGVQLFRLSVAESGRFPAIGHEYYRSGPDMLRNRISDYLARCVTRGELDIDDVELAADQFSELCSTDNHDRALFGLGDTITPDRIDRTVTGAVEVFLRAYGKKAA